MRARLTHPLVLVVALAMILRSALILDYRPAFLTYSDTGAYLHVAGGDLFQDPLRPAGYAGMLAALNAIGDLGVLVVVQHALGVLTLLAAYAAVRRLGAPRWAALVPAVAVAISVDQLTFEHAVLTEAPFTALLVAGLGAAVAALRGDALRWWALAGLLLGAAVWVRGAGLFVLPIAGLAALLAAGSARERVTRAAAFAVPALALVAVNLAAAPGLGGASGWASYARAAPFADCRVFAPPAGTEALCESTPADERPSPDHYAWSSGSPAQRLLGHGPTAQGDLVGSFGRAAMRAQPKAYATAVVKDLWRYVFPASSARAGDAADAQGMPLDLRLDWSEAFTLPRAERFYGEPQRIETGPVTEALAAVQEPTRLQGVWMVLALFLTAVALVRLRGREWLATALLAASALALLVVPVVTAVFNLRYAVPVMPLLAMTAALGAWQLSGRTRARPR